MKPSKFHNLIHTLLLLNSIFLINHTVLCADEDETLLKGINSYRTSLNLTTLTENNNADCLAGEIAEQLKDQPCSNTTGINTVPGTEPQFSNYPTLLAKCNLNISDTRDAAILTACVPNLVPSLVLSNFTQSQYAQYLNDTTYVGAGVGSEDNWIVVILTTKTPTGDFGSYKSGSSVLGVGVIYRLLFLLVTAIFLA